MRWCDSYVPVRRVYCVLCCAQHTVHTSYIKVIINVHLLVNELSATFIFEAEDTEKDVPMSYWYSHRGHNTMTTIQIWSTFSLLFVLCQVTEDEISEVARMGEIKHE